MGKTTCFPPVLTCTTDRLPHRICLMDVHTIYPLLPCTTPPPYPTGTHCILTPYSHLSLHRYSHPYSHRYTLAGDDGMMAFVAAVAKPFNHVVGMEANKDKYTRACMFQERFENRYRRRLPKNRSSLRVEIKEGTMVELDWTAADVVLIDWMAALQIQHPTDERALIWGDLQVRSLVSMGGGGGGEWLVVGRGGCP